MSNKTLDDMSANEIMALKIVSSFISGYKREEISPDEAIDFFKYAHNNIDADNKYKELMNTVLEQIDESDMRTSNSSRWLEMAEEFYEQSDEWDIN